MSAGPSRPITPSGTPGSATLRSRIEAVSRPLLVRLHRMPGFVVPMVTVLLFAVGALAPVPIAMAALVLAFVFIAWIGYLSWPAVNTSGRLLRLAMLTLIVVLAGSRL